MEMENGTEQAEKCWLFFRIKFQMDDLSIKMVNQDIWHFISRGASEIQLAFTSQEGGVCHDFRLRSTYAV